jgi:hypothetical protein
MKFFNGKLTILRTPMEITIVVTRFVVAVQVFQFAIVALF